MVFKARKAYLPMALVRRGQTMGTKNVVPIMNNGGVKYKWPWRAGAKP